MQSDYPRLLLPCESDFLEKRFFLASLSFALMGISFSPPKQLASLTDPLEPFLDAAGFSVPSPPLFDACEFERGLELI